MSSAFFWTSPGQRVPCTRLCQKMCDSHAFFLPLVVRLSPGFDVFEGVLYRGEGAAMLPYIYIIGPAYPCCTCTLALLLPRVLWILCVSVLFSLRSRGFGAPMTHPWFAQVESTALESGLV